MRTTFSITEAQATKARTWSVNHVGVTRQVKGELCVYHSKGGAIGGHLTYQFTPTSVGTIEQVHCACGAVLDLTDYDAF